MARIRTIKPEFWSDEKMVELAFEARLLFIGMLNFADDEGRMPYSPKRIKMQVFPGDYIDVEPLLKSIESIRRIQIYKVGEEEFLQIVNFKKHQRTEKHTPSRIPAPPLYISETSGGNPLPDAEISYGREKEKEVKESSNETTCVEITPSVEWDRPQPSQKVLEVSEKKPDYRQAIRERVWPSYLELTNRSESSYSWTPLRAAKAEARLKEFLKKTDGDLDKALAMMLRVVEAIGKSDFHMGRDVKSNGKRYVEWEDHLWRSQEQAEKWLAEAKPVARSGLSSGLPDVVEETMRQRKEPTVYDPEFEKGFQSFKAAAGKFGGSK